MTPKKWYFLLLLTGSCREDSGQNGTCVAAAIDGRLLSSEELLSMSIQNEVLHLLCYECLQTPLSKLLSQQALLLSERWALISEE